MNAQSLGFLLVVLMLDMENEQEKKIAASEAIELLQALMESLKPTSSEVDSDGYMKDLEIDQVKLIDERNKYTWTIRKSVSMENAEDSVQLDVDILNIVGVLKLYNLLNSILRSPAFPHKLNIFPSNLEEFAERPIDKLSSWTLVTEADLLGVEKLESYVVVTQKDIDEGIAHHIATYLSTVKEMKKITREQLLKALEKTFAVTKKKGKLHKLWDGSKTIYNLASWGAAAVGTYQNPAVTRAASAALSMPWRTISKLMPK